MEIEMITRADSKSYKYKLSILFDTSVNEQNFAGIINAIGTLNHFLKNSSPVSVEVNLVNDFVGVVPDSSIKFIELSDEKPYEEQIKKQYNNFDLLVTENEEIKKSLVSINEKLVTDIKGCIRFIEVFLRGHDIPWAFNMPIQHMPWTGFYIMCDEFGAKANELYLKFASKVPDSEGKEIAKYLMMHKVADLSYTRDKIMFYVQQRAYTKRAGLKNQDFTFECSYYLGIYYILLSGMIDQMARIFNNLLQLNIKPFTKIKLSDEDYRKALGGKIPDLLEVFDEKFINWDYFLRVNRNFVAHQGSITLSPLVKEPKVPLSDAEMEQKVNDSVDWNIVTLIFSDEDIKAHRELVKQLVYIDSLEVITEDTMTMEYKNPKTGKVEKGIFKPLLSVENDFEYFKEIILKTFEKLIEFSDTIKKETHDAETGK